MGMKSKKIRYSKQTKYCIKQTENEQRELFYKMADFSDRGPDESDRWIQFNGMTARIKPEYLDPPR